MQEKLSKRFLASSKVLIMSPNVHDVAAIASKITLSEQEQTAVFNQVNSWNTEKWKSLFKRAQVEVVIPQVYSNLNNLEVKPSLWNNIKALYYNAWVHKQNLLSESKKVADLFSHRGVAFLFLKGLVVDSLYQGSWRAMADIDVLVKDFDGARKSLSEVGYILDNMWAAEQGEFGVADLYCLERKTKIDLHFGEYPVHSLGSFHLPVWERRTPGEPAMSYEDTLLVLAAHVFNHGFYLMRDINDVYVMLQKELDWQYIAENAQLFHLEKPLCMLLKAAASVYDIRLDYVCDNTFSFLYKYGRRRHSLQGLLQPHHILIFSQMKNLVLYPGYWVYSSLFDTKRIIDPPWVGKASPSWINRVDRKQLCNMDEKTFHSIFSSDTAVRQDMRFIFEQGRVYIEKQNLQEKDIERAREIVRCALKKAEHSTF